MVLNMPFDTNISTTAAGAITDYSGYGNDGTLQNFDFNSVSGWTSSGRTGGAYDFDGSDDVINLGSADILDNMAQFTACAWIRPYSTTYENSYGLFINKVTMDGISTPGLQEVSDSLTGQTRVWAYGDTMKHMS